MRRVTQAYGEERYSDAIKIAGAIRQQIDTQPSERVRTTRSVLATWEAYARAMRGESGDAHEARILLSAAIDDMTAYLNELDTPDASPMLAFQDQLGDYYESATEFRRWRATAVLALAYRVRGYMRRTQNRLQEAVEDYQRAANLWQDVNVLVEDATTRNDLGRALGDQDRWDDARDLVNEALDIRRNRLGNWLEVAKSINTLAVLDVAEGRYSDARMRASFSLELFTALEYLRGQGLAFAVLAEATRRLATSDIAPTSVEDKVGLLREAYDCIIGD
ncbi:MAG: tetratricopeptide repeat protein [Caldilineaceae bacterium]